MMVQPETAFCETHRRTYLVRYGCSACHAERGLNTRYGFDGSDYSPESDDQRLVSQMHRITELMKDGEWRTLQEISNETRDPPASVSAQLRHLRKRRFGSHTVNKRIRGERSKGLWEYQVIN